MTENRIATDEPPWGPRLRELVADQDTAADQLNKFEQAVPNTRKKLQSDFDQAVGRTNGYLEGAGVSVDEAKAYLQQAQADAEAKEPEAAATTNGEG